MSVIRPKHRSKMLELHQYFLVFIGRKTTATKNLPRFQPTTVEEMKVFIGINMLMGIKKLPSLKDYWSSQEEFRDAANSS
nr:unnamed protein product [Callosobruchus chinensis]